MKRVCSFLCVACMLMALLTSCSKPAEEPVSDPSNPMTSTDEVSGVLVSEVSVSSDASMDASDPEMTGNSEKTSNTDVSKETKTTTQKTENGNKVIKDLKGYQFIIAKTQYDEVQDIELGVSDYIDAVYIRNKLIEKQYNCKIKYEYYEPQTFFQTAHASIMSGDKFADVIESELFSFGTLYINKLLYKLNNVPNLDLNSSIWISEYTNKATFKDGTFGITSKGLNPQSAISGVAVHYNKTLLNQLKKTNKNLKDPVDHIKAGTWTWDTMREMMLAARLDINGDGAYTDVDRFGATAASYDGIVPFFLSSGIQALVKDSSGKIKYNLNSTEAANAMLKLASVFTYQDGAFFNSTDYKKQLTMYENGKSLFFIAATGGQFDSHEDAVVPVPLYKSGEKYAAAVGHNARILSIPKTVKDPATTGLLLQAIAKAAESEYDVCMDTEISPLFKGSDSLDMINQYIVPGLSIDLMMFAKGSSLEIYNATECAVGNPIWNTVVKASDLVVGYGSAAQKALDEMFNNR